MTRQVQVFGPTYLDRVLRVDRPLRAAPAPPLDQSVVGRLRFSGTADLTLVDPEGASIVIEPPENWSGPRGVVDLSRSLGAPAGSRLHVRAEAWADDLGGMGAGFASAMQGGVVCALGSEDDPVTRMIEERLYERCVSYNPIRVPDGSADWTLLVSSGAHGDKLAVGFRGLQAAIEPGAWKIGLDVPCDVRIIAGVPNRSAAIAAQAPGPRLRVLAPSIANVLDRDPPILKWIAPIDVLCCNRGEWEALADREEIGARLSLLLVTEGEAGAWVRFTDPIGESRMIRVPAFPRNRPPRDTNRAGEAFAATFLLSLLDAGWRSESCTADVALVRSAMHRASAAAALTLDRIEFGFPDAREIDQALERGVVE